MSLAEQMKRFAALAANGNSGLSRAKIWPVSVTLSTDTTTPKEEIDCSGSPASRARVFDETRAGYVQRTIRTIMLTRAQLAALTSAPTVALGTEFTLTADDLNPENIGTVWRCFDLKDSDAGSELRCVCFRLD